MKLKKTVIEQNMLKFKLLTLELHRLAEQHE